MTRKFRIICQIWHTGLIWLSFFENSNSEGSDDQANTSQTVNQASFHDSLGFIQNRINSRHSRINTPNLKFEHLRTQCEFYEMSFLLVEYFLFLYCKNCRAIDTKKVLCTWLWQFRTVINLGFLESSLQLEWSSWALQIFARMFTYLKIFDSTLSSPFIIAAHSTCY